MERFIREIKKELKITYDAKKPEIIYTGQNNQKEQLVFRPEIQKEGKGFFIHFADIHFFDILV